MKHLRLLRSAVPGAVAALALFAAAPLSAQQYPAQSAPPVYSGLDCSRCGVSVTSYCVVNPLRFEYTCAPQGTYACAGISRTSFCRYGTACWDGYCR